MYAKDTQLFIATNEDAGQQHVRYTIRITARCCDNILVGRLVYVYMLCRRGEAFFVPREAAARDHPAVMREAVRLFCPNSCSRG